MQVSAFAAGILGGFHGVLEELAKAFALGRLHAAKAHADTGRSATRDDSAEGEAFDPDLAVGDPQADLVVGASSNRAGGLNEASAHASIAEISPYWGGGLIDAQFYRNKPLDAGVAAAVVGRAGIEHVGLKRR